MTGNLITSLLSLATKLLPSITASAHAPSSSSSNSNSSAMGRARAVEEDLERLMQTLERIKATLYDAEEREIRDRSVKLWLKELKKLAYDAEDVLSEYQYEVTHLQIEARKASQVSGFHKRKQMECIVSIPDGMAGRLNKIRSQFDEIAKDREALQLRESDGFSRSNNNRPQTGHMVDEASIFGRDAEKKEVIDFLLSEEEKFCSVISIVGKGGLGKTTIAQLVYKDLIDHRYFDLFGWVCVSEEFDVPRLIKATLESVSKINYGVTELSPLQEELAKTVRRKTILLVFDDVWNENQSLWELFLVPFKEAKMVRILMTTRNKKVAQVMQTITYFSPSNLPEDSCWQLFQHYAFSGTSDIVQTHLIDMGMEIMRKCGGLPLAIKSIASLLRDEMHEECWREILESDLWESNPSNDIFSALQISYAHLPTHLKPCFLFCSMYPKDYIFEKINLIELWISHGYIESRRKKTVTEIGIEYYEELKVRSFLDDFPGQSSDYCKLHDMVHDLARINSENEHYSVQINQPLDIQERIILREAYHLYVRGFAGYISQILQQNLKGLRTFSTDLRGCSGYLEHQYCKYFINNTLEIDLHLNIAKFEALRVLELKGYRGTKIPDSISQLKHLVYLCVTSFCLKMLPTSIGLLYNLQTLILDCPFLEYLPKSIGDLPNLLKLAIGCDDLKEVPIDLKHLCNLNLTIDTSEIQPLPHTIGCLSSLEELNFMSWILSLGKEVPLHGFDNTEVDSGKLDYVPHGLVNFPAIKTMRARLRVRTLAWLKDMNDLEGKLSIEGLINISNLVDVQCANLRNKCKLETLDLCWYPEIHIAPYSYKSELILSLRKGCEGGLVGANDVYFFLLECLQPHRNLKKLRVRRYQFATIPEWMGDPFSLQSIQEISLEYCENIQSLPFLNLHTLKQLKIEECSSIRVLQLEQLPSKLEKLQILSCHHMEFITGLGVLDMLVALEISFCKALKSLAMDEWQLVESSVAINDSSNDMPHIRRRSISSLTRLKIINCGLLCVIPEGLIPSRPCYVCVCGCGCPNLEIEHWQSIKSDFFNDVFFTHKEEYEIPS